MKKSILLVALLVSINTHAEIHTHNVYVHKAGIDTSIYQTKPVDMTSTINNLAATDMALVGAFKAKRDAKKAEKRNAEYTQELIQATSGLKNINVEAITPLIQKYPEKSSELLDLLQQSN